MANPYGITLDDHSLRWAAAEGVPESVIAAICLLREKSVNEIVARLSPAELEQVIEIAGRSPSCYPPGVYAALKGKRDLASPPPRADRPPPKGAANEQASRLRRLQLYVSMTPPTAQLGPAPKKPEHVPERALKLPDGACWSKT